MPHKVPCFSCMDDCIHLHACRRVQAIGKSHRLSVPRYCSEDCSCYLSRNTDTYYINIDTALDYARRGASSIEEGYDPYDVYASIDMNGASLSEILDDFEDDA